MLVLTIKVGDEFVIGEGSSAAFVKVISRGKNSVRVGIEAPKSIRVLRGELLGRKVA